MGSSNRVALLKYSAHLICRNATRNVRHVQGMFVIYCCKIYLDAIADVKWDVWIHPNIVPLKSNLHCICFSLHDLLFHSGVFVAVYVLKSISDPVIQI